MENRPGESSRHTIANLLNGLLNAAPDDAQLTVELRALQTAAWHLDLYVKINLARLLHSEERPRVAAADADAAMAAYRQPHRAITVALTRAGADLRDVGAVRIADVSDNGTSIDTPDALVLLGTSRAVRAQRQLRLAAGAGGDDALLPHSPKVLTEAGTDLGIHVYGRRAERTRDHTEGALRALGVTVSKLP